MKDLNRLELIGTVGKDVEAKTSATGKVYASLLLAVNEYVKDQEKNTTWFNVVFFGKDADELARRVKKGTRLLVHAKVKKSTREKDGQKIYDTSFIGENFFMPPEVAYIPEQAQETGLPHVADEDIPF